MSNKITIKKGLDIRLVGKAETVLHDAPMAETYAVCPDDYIGVIPKMLVAEGEHVLAGDALFFDKAHPEVLFSSPVSGTVKAVVRGEKRKILAVEIQPDANQEHRIIEGISLDKMDAQGAKDLLMKAGFWPMIIQRPFGIIASAATTPRDIFISALDTAPLAADVEFTLQGQHDNLVAGISLLKKLTTGNVYFSTAAESTLAKGIDTVHYEFSGKHPAGNVGTQIAKIAPIAKGDIVWTVSAAHVAMIGHLVRTGEINFEKIVAVAGSCTDKPGYRRIVSGAKVSSVIGDALKKDEKARIISGNPLTGKKTSEEGYIGFYDNLLCAIPEGDKYELLGWIAPRFKKFSMSRSYFSWLQCGKKYDLDTNLNGGVRTLVLSDIYNKVVPLDIYPVYLIKACLAGDIDKMENLGIYEVIEEDLALCEFICPSKIEWQSILREGINLMIKEL